MSSIIIEQERLEKLIENTVTKSEFRERFAQIEGAIFRNSLLIKLSIALNFFGLATVGAMFVKMFFF